MRHRLLAAVRAITATAYAVLDTPARMRSAVRSFDALADRLLDPPAVVIEREQTVPDYLQNRLALYEAQRERSLALLSRLTEQQARLALLLEQRDAELFALDPFN